MTQIAMMEMQMAKTMACDLLMAHGFQGNLLKAEIWKKKSKKAQQLVTVPNSKEHVETLSKASTHGAIFVVMGRLLFTTDDMFMAKELPTRIQQIGKWKKKKIEMLAGIE